MPPAKRPSAALNGIETSPPSKKPHPFFSAAGAKPPGNFLPSPPTLIHFLHLDPFAPSSSKSPPQSTSRIPVAFYDLDGTLIKTRKGGDFPAGRDDWQWWHSSVPATLKAEHESGKHIVVLSNQGDGREKIRTEWRAKLPLIAAKMPEGVPIRILAALSKFDVYRKPNSGMFDTVVDLYRSKGFEVDVEQSVYVGDAAGRLSSASRKKDHGDTDFKLALNVGLKFVTPEEHFLGEARHSFPDPPNGFKPSKSILITLPRVLPSNSPIAREEVELVLFVGPPASGKTSFFRRYFQAKYEHVNQDLLGTRDKCLRVAEALLRSGKSVVVDNTNRNRSTRAYWIALANQLSVPVRLFHFACPVELAIHNNMYRACYAPPDEPARTLLPLSAFYTYNGAFEKPEKDEGFEEVRTVNFTWEGTEEQKKLWDRYMLEVKR